MPDQDSSELDALFDSVAAQQAGVVKNDRAVVQNDPVIDRIGKMTRALHDTLRELGLNAEIEKVSASIPDARNRLAYIASMTQKAANRVLDSVDAAQPAVNEISEKAVDLAGQWKALMSGNLDRGQFYTLATRTHGLLMDIPAQTAIINSQLIEIMIAQDFQDITGQVIKRIIDITHQMENQLLALLLENAPAAIRGDIDSGLMNGPVVSSDGRADVVTSQDQVDELLGSLGF